jgi:hypothetical protein
MNIKSQAKVEIGADEKNEFFTQQSLLKKNP